MGIQFDADIQSYLDIMNDITKSNFSSSYDKALKAISNHFESRGLGVSGMVQEGLQDFNRKYSTDLNTALMQHTASAIQMQIPRVQQQQYLKWAESQAGGYASQADQLKIERAMQDQGEGMGSSKAKFQDYLNRNYPYASQGYYGYSPEGFASFKNKNAANAYDEWATSTEIGLPEPIDEAKWRSDNAGLWSSPAVVGASTRPLMNPLPSYSTPAQTGVIGSQDDEQRRSKQW